MALCIPLSFEIFFFPKQFGIKIIKMGQGIEDVGSQIKDLVVDPKVEEGRQKGPQQANGPKPPYLF